ncbi:hypothetical protein CDL12_29931 [Handroanthus impetiginosus]|uniref:Uncharacterized protein n=1 Tax=Handroanthus impetiginosus TaxID=429701 RepID=A0A2G9FY51_9LAMI|nr:hypothetical protein CDL12_29931 [Handroanthus impetiginosus]
MGNQGYQEIIKFTNISRNFFVECREILKDARAKRAAADVEGILKVWIVKTRDFEEEFDWVSGQVWRKRSGGDAVVSDGSHGSDG